MVKNRATTSSMAEKVDLPDLNIPPEQRGDDGDGVGLHFMCTACGKLLASLDVQKHHELGVGICRECKNLFFSSPFTKDDREYENECRWCGDGGSIVMCDSCKKSFCQDCIKRNFSAEILADIIRLEWRCFCCNPAPLQKLIRDYNELEARVKLMPTPVPDCGEECKGNEPEPRLPKRLRKRRKIA